jgi:hypothetical protein
MKKKAKELKTIKVLPSTVANLNWLSGVMVKTQYEVADLLAKDRRESMEGAIKNAKKKTK